MPSKRRGARQSQSDKKVKAGLVKLKKRGLYRGDLRKPVTAYGRKVFRDYQDVLNKKAAVVSTRTRKEARLYADVFKVKYNKVAVPKETRKENVRYNPKTGEIYSYRHQYGKRIKAVKVVRRADSWHGLPPEKPGRFYRMPFGAASHGKGYTFDTRADLAKFMQPYETSKNPYNNWWRFVEIIDVEPGEMPDDE